MPSDRAVAVMTATTIFFFETIFMVLSICYFLLSITPRHRLPVINSQSFRNLGIFSESEVRVF
jgi:hypothetical protein